MSEFEGVQISVSDSWFAERRQTFTEANEVAVRAKSEHDAMVDLLTKFGMPLPEGVERLEKRGRKAATETPTTEDAEPEAAPAE